VFEDGLRKRKFQHPTGNHSPMHDATNYVTRSPITESATVHEDELSTATRSPTERVENLLQSDVDNERRKRKLRKDDSRKPVDPKESEPELEDDEDDESIEQNYDDSCHEPAFLSPRQQVICKARSRNSNSDHHNFPCKKKHKKKWNGLDVLQPTACVHIAERLTSDGGMNIFLPPSSTFAQPRDSVSSITMNSSDIVRNISKLVENSFSAMLVKGPKTWVKTLLDSGYNCSIFTDRSMFRDYHVYRVPI
jgi:hypothetical protein